MADTRSRSSEGADDSKPEPKAADNEEIRYGVDELVEVARGRLGASPHAVAGALHKGSQKTFTIDEAKERVAKFLDTEHEAPA